MCVCVCVCMYAYYLYYLTSLYIYQGSCVMDVFFCIIYE